MNKDMSHGEDPSLNIQLLRGHQMEDRVGTETKPREDGEEVKRSSMMEPSTLWWPEDTEGQARGQISKGDRVSVRSDVSLRETSSWTESERALKAERGGGGKDVGAGLTGEEKEHLEMEAGQNRLPEKAAQVFSPAVTVLSSPRDTEAFWEGESERSPFLGPPEVDYNQHGYQYEFEENPPSSCKYT